MNNYSYFTLLSSDSYLDGIKLLKESMLYTGTQYPLSVMTTPNLSEETINILKEMELNIVPVNIISTPDIIMEHNKKIDPNMAETWKYCLTKFQVWKQTQYDKIIMIDCDLMFLKNCDHCFEMPNMTAALDGEYFNLWEGWPHFNSGFFVLEPNEKTYEDLVCFANNLDPECVLDGYGRKYVIADQELLNLYYNDWVNKPELHLNKYYNIFAPHLADVCREDILNNCYFIHFVGSKPWNNNSGSVLNAFEGISLYTYALGSAFVNMYNLNIEFTQDNFNRVFAEVLTYYFNQFYDAYVCLLNIENKTEEDINKINYYFSLYEAEKNLKDTRSFLKNVYDNLCLKNNCSVNYYIFYTSMVSYDFSTVSQRIKILELFKSFNDKIAEDINNIKIY